MSRKQKCRPSAQRPQLFDAAELLKPALHEDPIERLPIGPLITDESQITDEYIAGLFRRMQEHGIPFTATPEEVERTMKQVRERLARRSSSSLDDDPSPK